jgi:hypothetical protein
LVFIPFVLVHSGHFVLVPAFAIVSEQFGWRIEVVTAAAAIVCGIVGPAFVGVMLIEVLLCFEGYTATVAIDLRLFLFLLLVPAQFWVMIVELLLIFKIASAAIATELGISWISYVVAGIVFFEFAVGAKHLVASEASAVFCFFYTLGVSAFEVSAPGTGSVYLSAVVFGETWMIRNVSNYRNNSITWIFRKRHCCHSIDKRLNSRNSLFSKFGHS